MKNKKEDNKKYVYVGVDSEGYYDTKRKSHICDMLTIGDVTTGKPGDRLTQKTIYNAFKYATMTYREKGIEPIFQLYFGNYDITQWIRGNDNYILNRIYNRDERSFTVADKEEATRYKDPFKVQYPVSINKYGEGFSMSQYRVDWLTGHWFKLSWVIPETCIEAKNANDEDLIKWDGVTIYDCGEVFSAKFVSSVKAILGDSVPEDKLAMLENGKGDRDKHYTRKEREADWEEVKEYNRLECYVLSELLLKFSIELESIFGEPIDPHLESSGKLAQQWLDDINNGWGNEKLMLTSVEVADTIGPASYNFINNAYTGGWFDTYAHGIIDRDVYEYDINSAYPNVIKDLPSLKNSFSYWIDGDKLSKESLEKLSNDGNIVFVELRAEATNTRVGPLNHRSHIKEANMDFITRPSSCVTVAEMKEIVQAEKSGLLRPEWSPLRAMVIEIDKSLPKPFAKIEEFYAKRLAAVKNSTRGKVYKLVMNSIYGKMAQSIGNPKWSNPVYAALITSAARTSILEIIGTHPNGINSLIRVETDAVFFDERHPNIIPDDSKLGAFDEEIIKGGIWSLSPGIWGSLDSSIDVHGIEHKDFNLIKTRGMSEASLRDKLLDVLIPAFERMEANREWDSSFSFEVSNSFSMVTLSEAVSQGKPWLAGEFLAGSEGLPERSRTVSFDLAPKRENIVWNEEKEWFEGDCYNGFESVLYLLGGSSFGAETTGYAKKKDMVGNLVFTQSELSHKPDRQQALLEKIYSESDEEMEYYDKDSCDVEDLKSILDRMVKEMFDPAITRFHMRPVF